MTQYFYDFSGDSIGSPPAGWTAFGFSSTLGYKTGNVVDIGSGVKALRIVDTGYGNYGVGYTHTALGTYTPGGAEAIEMVAKFRPNSSQGSSFIGLRFFNNYTLTPWDATRWGLLVDYAGTPGDYIGGPSTLWNLALSTSTWYWMRFRREGNGVFKARIWVDGGSEPTGSWDKTSSADTGVTSGTFGIYSYLSAASIDFTVIGIGTANDDAPTTDGPPPVTPVLMGQIVM